MIELTVFAAMGVALFVGFLALGFSGGRRKAPDSAILSAVGQMVRLEGLSFASSARLLDDTEYRMISSNPYLQEVAKRFRKERRDLAILWISVLMSDVKTLWRFRRFLIRQGAPAQFREELEIVGNFVVSLVLLSILKVLIRAWGPFALPNVARRATRLVDKMSHGAANALSHIPSAGWAELERTWGSSPA